jgi:putative ABC transport system permease protein
MLSVYLTLSARYLRRRWFYALLIVASIASGVSLLVATRAINQTMNRAAQAAATPMAGAVDLILTNGETLDSRIADDLKIPGIAMISPRIFATVEIPAAGLQTFDPSDLVDDTHVRQLPPESRREVLLVGIDVRAEVKEAQNSPWKLVVSDKTKHGFAIVYATFGRPVIVGKALDDSFGDDKTLEVVSDGNRKPTRLKRVGPLDAEGPAAALGGNVLFVDIDHACDILGLPRGKAHRIDITLAPGADRDAVRGEILKRVAGRAEVRTPEEQNQAVQNVMAGMQLALLLSGIAALVVGLFLVYNALAVSVAERRHEIGILLAVGATRSQIRRLFAGEAALLGLAGSLLGIPLGIGFAYLALEPVRGVLQEIFFTINASHVEVDGWLIAMALFAGLTTAVAAALVPAIQASREKPAEAVRRMPVQPTWRYRFVQIASSMVMLLVGVACVVSRDWLPERFGMYAGLGLVVVASLVATPLLTALAARLLHPLVRRCFGLEGRLAADNLIRSPGRTGIVIAALAAGVALFMQTAGTIKSNRVAIRQWVDDSIGADLCVTSGSPVSAGGRSKPMEPALAKELEKIPGVERALPVQMRKPIFRNAQVMMIVLDAGDYFTVDSKRNLKMNGLDLFKQLSETPDGVLVSDNFAAMHHVGVGDTIPLAGKDGTVRLKILGAIPDYSWNLGTLFIHRTSYERHWDDAKVDVFDIYLRQQAEDESDEERQALKLRVQEEILKRHGAQHGLFVLTREELQNHIDDMIQRLYGIAYGQQFVVLFVAALGVVTALLISVLQRRREMGLLRAIGASRAHVIRCVLAEAALMGVIGSLIGFVVGIPLEWFALEVVILEESGYLFPLIIPWQEALLIAGAAILVATLAGLGPSLYAVRQRIPEAIAME